MNQDCFPVDQWTVGSCFLLKVLNFKFDQFQVLNQNIETRKLKQLLIRQLSWGCFSAGPTQPCWALHISDSTFYTKPGPVQSATCSYGFTFFGMVLYCWVCICGGSDVKSVGIRVVVPWWTLTVDFHPPPLLFQGVFYEPSTWLGSNCAGPITALKRPIPSPPPSLLTHLPPGLSPGLSIMTIGALFLSC